MCPETMMSTDCGKQPDCAESQLFVVRERDRAAVVSLENVNGSELSAEAMCHADAPSFDFDHLSVPASGVRNRIVVTGGAQHRRELLQPVEDIRCGQVTSVEYQIDASKELLGLGAKLIEMADNVWQMGVGEEADNHEGDYTWCATVSL